MEAIATKTTDAKQSFSDALEQHRGIVFKVANTYAWEREDRADLVQEIATQLWRAWPKYDPGRSISTWMYRIALNVAISHVRGHGRRLQHVVPLDENLPDIADGNAVDPETDDQVRALHRFIATLEPLNRALLLLYLEERSTREMAEVLGISESNVTTKINRLKQRIVRLRWCGSGWASASPACWRPGGSIAGRGVRTARSWASASRTLPPEAAFAGCRASSRRSSASSANEPCSRARGDVDSRDADPWALTLTVPPTGDAHGRPVPHDRQARVLPDQDLVA